MRSFFDKNDLIITLSSQTEEELVGLEINTSSQKLFHPVYEKKKPDSSKLKLRQKYGFEKEDKIILFFGLIREYKGLDIFIEALNSINISGHNIKPLIAGEFYDEKEKYLKLVTPSHKNDYQIIDRFVDDSESVEILSLSDVLVLPYKTASQSGVLADALNVDLPVIVSNHPGLTEYIEHNENGMIFENENTEQLASQITNFFSDISFQKKIRSNISELKHQLSWKNFSAQLLNNM